MAGVNRGLPSVIRSRINRIAHAAAIQFEETTRQSLTAELQRLASAGGDVQAMGKYLDAHGLANGGKA